MLRFLKFGAVGILNTIITIISFILFTYLGMDYILANIVAYGFGVVNSYYWNNHWVFKVKSKNIHLFLKFIAVNLITLGINTFILFLFVKYFMLLPVLAQIIATGIGMIINFLLNKFWTFNIRTSNEYGGNQ
jgi:putative flippase GtrA